MSPQAYTIWGAIFTKQTHKQTKLHCKYKIRCRAYVSKWSSNLSFIGFMSYLPLAMLAFLLF